MAHRAWYAWQFAKAQYIADKHGWTRFVTMQNHYNLVFREEEREMIPFCLDQGVGLLPWSPLARGFLTGNRTRDSSGEKGGDSMRAKSDDFAHKLYYQDCDFDVVDKVVALAKERKVTPAKIALAWLLHQTGVTAPIIGASKIDHLKDAIESIDIKLSLDECRMLEAPYQPHSMLTLEV